MVQIKGIDVSSWQGNIDWQKVKSDDVEFVFIKATQGTNYSKVDYFRNNAPKALGFGLNVGGYHFGTFSTVPEAIVEARYFLSIVKDFKLTYPLVLDLEENKKKVNKKQLTDAAIAFLDVLKNAGYVAMLYTGKSFLESQLDESRIKYPLWLARYGAQLGRDADIWQYTQEGKINGITGNVDVNWAYRDFSTAECEKKPAVKIAQSNAVMWDGSPLKASQIGRITVLKPINLWKRIGDKLENVRILQSGEVYRVYGYDDQHGGQYSVGDGHYITKMDGYVKYETPSREILDSVNR